ncbi:transcription factor bHLH145-like [Bidens hawaiensis]|uniref:transcription factor bHLH145-like n=1 Tax=Bidens hawaiensis TaxID=980011 RepID=UPI00404AB20A
MEKCFNSRSQDHQIDWQSPNPNLPSAQFGLGPRVMLPSFGNVVSPPVIYEPSGWFYGLPRHRQGFGVAPVVNSMAKEVKETFPEASPVVARETKVGQKKFLVFDQSGDQTTLMYGFGVGPSSTRYQFPSLNKPKPQDGSHTVCVDKLLEENNGIYSESEMREDTEELNALLYSDDDEDDETSTGHSPNSMTGFKGQKREFEHGEEEEVASSGGAWKRCKKDDKGSFVNSLEDTASSSGKSGINCSANEVFEEEEYDSFSSGNKKLRIEKIKETINLLQNLIPGDTRGKNAIMVIDEAIHYLTSLKVKAKALGLDSF